jgi:hypothetical protein
MRDESSPQANRPLQDTLARFAATRYLSQNENGQLKKLSSLCVKLMADLNRHSRIKKTFYQVVGEVQYQEFFFGESKPIIDEIDSVLAKDYGFTSEEIDFIISYDIKYRMGIELDG